MTQIENKAYGTEAAAFEDLHRAFSAFRETNDDRIGQIEQRLSADALTEEKLMRIDRALDETKGRLDRLTLDAARPRIGADRKDDAASREHKSAFLTYMRAGEAGGLKSLEAKTMAAASGPDGGYLVPQPAEREILRRMAQISPMRAIANVVEISTHSLRRAFSWAGPQAGWVAESDPRPQSANQQISDMTFPAMELYAMPAATQTLLDDAVVDIEQWIADEVSVAFAEQEGAAFVKGDGVNKPTGFLNYPMAQQSAWSFGKLGYIDTGVAGAFAAASPSDILFDLVYALKAGYRQNARFMMNRKTQSAIRKFKTTTGEYLWEPPATLGAAATLMNFPVSESEEMPDIATDSTSVAFGDFHRGYVVVDRSGVRVLRDPYSAKPYVLFYTTKRVGGGVQDFDAIKLLKFGVA
ncbi:MAG: phage major capsid protein [Hyphomicrobiales bacterium]|nr:phage major capsid protein [Hyphomicrobiales bacterium]